MVKTKLFIGIIFTSLLAGCAGEKTPKAYVSPLEYKDYSCNQVSKEMAYISSQYNQATASNPTADALGVALIAYGMSQGYGFYSDGGEDPAIEQLRAKYDALHQASIQKDCE